MSNQWDIYAIDRTVVIGRNPEAAFVGNPRGEIYGEIYTIEATNDHGERKVLTSVVFDTEDEAYNFIRTLDSNSPDNGGDWEYTYSVYGSEAYLANWVEEEAAMDRLDRDMEEGWY